MALRTAFKEAFKKHLGIERLAREWAKDLNIRGAVVKEGFMMADNVHGLKLYIDLFPIFRNDTFEMVLKKYIDMYPEEITEFTNQMSALQSSIPDAKGMSKQRTQRLVCKLPETLATITRQYFPDYLEDKKGLHKLQQIIPKCFVGKI